MAPSKRGRSVTRQKAAVGAATTGSADTEDHEPHRHGTSLGLPVIFGGVLIAIVFARSTGYHILQNVANPVREFQILYCAYLATTTLTNLQGHQTFYEWFSAAQDFSPNTKRGMGHHPVRPFGFLPVPHMSSQGFRCAGLGFVASLYAACLDYAPKLFLSAALVLYFCYFTQLWCETRAGGHGTITIPAVLLVMVCSPTLSAGDSEASTWPLEVLKLILASNYAASGLLKVGASVFFGRFWGNGSVIQYYLFDAMWSRPGGTISYALMSFLVCSPILCSLAMPPSLLFECGGLAVPFLDARSTVVYAISGVMFHTGIWVLQGLDFVTYWSPIFLAYIDYGALGAGDPWGDLLVDAKANPWRVLPVLVYTAAQLFTAFSFRDVRSSEILPLTCCPMFLIPANIFDNKLPNFFVMTSSKDQRSPGNMEPLLYTPLNTVYKLQEEELKRLPYHTAIFATLSQVPQALQHMVKPQYLGKKFVLFSSFELSKDLKQMLRTVMSFCASGNPADWYDVPRLKRIVRLQHECRTRFNTEAAAADASS